MRTWVATVISAAILVAGGLLAGPALSQEQAVTNPLAGNPFAIGEGASLFRANCSPCHGLNARGGGRGPDLTAGRWTHGASDSDVFRTVTQGVLGTEMPASSFEDSETWAIITYLRSLSPPKRPKVSGNAKKGDKIFSETMGCSNCHMINGHGGLLGPDLSRVGASRSESYIIDSIRDPNKDLTNGMLDPNNHYGLPLVYDTVTVVMPSGEKVVGVAKNEDTFSIQLLDTNERLQLLLKKDVKEVLHERKSLMPAYSVEMISSADLQDLLAYLENLQGE
jgi:cytochrome c oxidase cbb3-type subunit III